MAAAIKVTRLDKPGPLTKNTVYEIRLGKQHVESLRAALTEAEQRFTRVRRRDIARRYAAIRRALPECLPYVVRMDPFAWLYVSRALRRFESGTDGLRPEHRHWGTTYHALRRSFPHSVHECRKLADAMGDPMPYFVPPELHEDARRAERAAAVQDLPLEVWENDPAERWED